MEINVHCKLSDFREFLILSTCRSFIPEGLIGDVTVFPERPRREGTMYVEAEDKVTLKRVREINFVRVSEVLGIIYNSKSGRTRLKWRSVKDDWGNVTGEVTTHSLVNLFASKILDESYVEEVSRRAERGN